MPTTTSGSPQQAPGRPLSFSQRIWYGTVRSAAYCSRLSAHAPLICIHPSKRPALIDRACRRCPALTISVIMSNNDDLASEKFRARLLYTAASTASGATGPADQCSRRGQSSLETRRDGRMQEQEARSPQPTGRAAMCRSRSRRNGRRRAVRTCSLPRTRSSWVNDVRAKLCVYYCSIFYFHKFDVLIWSR